MLYQNAGAVQLQLLRSHCRQLTTAVSTTAPCSAMSLQTELLERAISYCNLDVVDLYLPCPDPFRNEQGYLFGILFADDCVDRLHNVALVYTEMGEKSEEHNLRLHEMPDCETSAGEVLPKHRIGLLGVLLVLTIIFRTMAGAAP